MLWMLDGTNGPKWWERYSLEVVPAGTDSQSQVKSMEAKVGVWEASGFDPTESREAKRVFFLGTEVCPGYLWEPVREPLLQKSGFSCKSNQQELYDLGERDMWAANSCNKAMSESLQVTCKSQQFKWRILFLRSAWA